MFAARKIRRSAEPRVRRSLLLSLLLFLFATLPNQARSQETWEYSPYRIQVWIESAAAAEVTPGLLEEIRQTLVDRSYVVAGASWQLGFANGPERVRTDQYQSLAEFTADNVTENDLVVIVPKVDGKVKKQVTKLAKLIEMKARFGICDAEHRHLGVLTQEAANSDKELATLVAGASVKTPTIKELVSLVLDDQLDGAVVYRSFARTAIEQEQLIALPIQSPGDSIDIFENSDKVMLLNLHVDPTGFRIQVRELDSHTRFAGPLIERYVRQAEHVPDEAFEAMVEAFAPLTRVEEADKKDAVVRVRAGGLFYGTENSPSEIKVLDILQPIVRRNDRYGKPLDKGIQVLPWTFLYVADRRDAVLNCQVYSGIRSSLGGRTSNRTKKFALGIRPTGTSTELTLHSLDLPPDVLAGYDAYSKYPTLEEPDPEAKKEMPELMGRSDWRGVVTVRQGDLPMRIVYIKNGNQLLARLPIIPGLEAEQVALMPNDDQRLYAEAFVKEVQTRIMNLVAQREIQASRIRLKIQQRKIDGPDGAKELMDTFKKLETRADLEKRLNEQKQRVEQGIGDDARTRLKVDKLFGLTRELLNKYIDPKLDEALGKELDAVTGG